MSDTPGYFTPGGIDSLAIQEEGTDIVPASTGEVLGATFGQAFADNPTSRLTRQIDRNLNATPRTMQAAEANEMFGVPGRLAFEEPVTMDVARDLYDHHRANAVRDDTLARRQGGVGTGMLARFGVGVAASMLDPLNVASAFIPFLGEARVAAMFGGAAATRGGVLAARVAQGAGEGFLGAVALEPLNMYLAAQDRDDYTMGDALVNLAFGTVAGGVLHGVVGTIRDRNRPSITPDQHEAAVRQGTAAMVEGRPVQAAEAMELVAVREARTQLQDWYQSVQRVAQDADQALATADSRANVVRTAEARFTELRAQADELRNEAGELRGRMVDDPYTEARLAAVDDELSKAIPAARRFALEQERSMLIEGRDAAADALDNARSEAQADGVEILAGKAGAAAEVAEQAVREARTAQRQADKLLAARSTSLSARESMTAELAARTIRQLAGRLAAPLSNSQAADFASRIIRSKPENAQATIAGIVDELSSKRWKLLDGETTQVDVAASKMAEANQALANAENDAATSLGDGLRVRQDHRVAEARSAAAAIDEAAPKVEGTQADQLAELQEANQRAMQLIEAQDKQEAERAAAEGRKPAKPSQELEEAAEIEKEGSAWAKAYEAAAVCMTGR